MSIATEPGEPGEPRKETLEHDGTRTPAGSSYGDFVPEAKRKAERTSPGTVDTPETMASPEVHRPPA